MISNNTYIHINHGKKSLVHIDTSNVGACGGGCLVQMPALSPMGDSGQSCFLRYYHRRKNPVPFISPAYSFFFTPLLPLSPVLTRLVAPL